MFLTVVLFGYLITVSLLQLNLTIQRRSQAHVENFPPSEKIKKDSIIKQKYYPLTLIFTRTVPALLRYPKLFARIHSHNFDRYANSHSLHPPPAEVVFLAPSKEGTLPFKTCSISDYSLPAKPLVTDDWRLVTNNAVADH